MSDMNKLIRMIVSVLVFCTGLLVMGYEARSYTTALNIAREKLKKDVIYQQQLIIDREIITYAELIATMLQPIEYDMVIDGVRINKDEYSIDNIKDYFIEVSDYTKRYQYGEGGEILTIIYSRKS